MRRHLFIGFALVLALLALVVPGMASANQPVTGAAFTTVNEADPPDGDGTGHCKNGNPNVNCNIYDGKEFVWLNGGPETMARGGVTATGGPSRMPTTMIARLGAR